MKTKKNINKAKQENTAKPDHDSRQKKKQELNL